MLGEILNVLIKIREKTSFLCHLLSSFQYSYYGVSGSIRSLAFLNNGQVCGCQLIKNNFFSDLHFRDIAEKFFYFKNFIDFYFYWWAFNLKLSIKRNNVSVSRYYWFQSFNFEFLIWKPPTHILSIR